MKPEPITYTPDALLDELIARGWGDTPRYQIPKNWRKRLGPGAGRPRPTGKRKKAAPILSAEEVRKLRMGVRGAYRRVNAVQPNPQNGHS